MKLRAPTLPAVLSGIAMMLVAVPAFAQTGPERLLPGGTLFYAGTSDLNGFVNTVKTKPFGRILQEEEVQDFLEKPMSMVREQIDRLNQMANAYEPLEGTDLDVEKLVKGPYGSCFIAFTHLTFPQTEDGEPDLGIVVGIEPKPGAVDVIRMCQEVIFAMVAHEGEQIAQKQINVGDLSFSKLESPDGDGPPLCFAKVGNMSVLSFSERSIREMLERAGGARQASLATSPGFAKGVAHAGQSLGGSPLLYVNVGGMVNMGMTGLRFAERKLTKEGLADREELKIIKKIIKALEMSGFDKLGAVYAMTGWEGDVAVSRTFTSYDKSAGGLLGAFLAWGRPINRDLLKIVPKDATSFSTMHFELASVYDVIMNGLGEIMPEIKQMADQAISGFEAQIAGTDENGAPLWDIRNDFLGAVGGEFVMMSSPGAPTMMGPGSDSVGWWECSNPQALQKSLNYIAAIPGQLAGFPLTFKEEEHGGVKMKVLDPMSLGPAAMVAGGMKPTYAIHNGRLYFGTSPETVKKLVGSLQAPPEENVTSKPDFARHWQHVADDAVLTYLSYADTKKNFENMYQGLLGVLPTVMMAMPINQADLPVEMSLLPTAEAISQHMFGTMTYSQEVEGGELMVSRGPFGSEMIAGAGLAAIGIAAGVSYGIASADVEVTHETTEGNPVAQADPSARAREQLGKMESWLTIYIVYNSTSPASLSELTKATERFPEGINQGEKMPKTDPWGNPYSYLKRGDGYQLWSHGPDGVNDNGAGDDLTISRE